MGRVETHTALSKEQLFQLSGEIVASHTLSHASSIFDRDEHVVNSQRIETHLQKKPITNCHGSIEKINRGDSARPQVPQQSE